MTHSTAVASAEREVCWEFGDASHFLVEIPELVRHSAGVNLISVVRQSFGKESSIQRVSALPQCLGETKHIGGARKDETCRRVNRLVENRIQAFLNIHVDDAWSTLRHAQWHPPRLFD